MEITITPTPAQPLAEMVSVKSGETEIKSGRRNRKSDEDIIKQIISLANSLLADGEDDDKPEETEDAKEEPKANEGAPSKELEALNARRDAILEYAANNNIYGGKEK